MVLSPPSLYCTSAPTGPPSLQTNRMSCPPPPSPTGPPSLRSAAASASFRARQLQQQEQQQEQSLFGGMWPSEMEGLLQSRVALTVDTLPGERRRIPTGTQVLHLRAGASELCLYLRCLPRDIACKGP